MQKLRVLLLAAILGLTACGTATVPQAQADFCKSLTTLDVALGQMAGISAQSTVSDLKTAQQAVDTAAAGVQKSAAGLREAKLDDVNAAYNELNQVTKSVSSQDTLAQAAVQITPAVAKVQSASSSLGKVACPK